MYISVFIILLAFSAFFSGSETAFLSLGKIRARQISEMNSLKAKRVTSLLSDPNRLLVNILIGNTLVNIAASSVLSDIFYDHLGEKGIVYSIICMTAIVLVFGEVTPKMFSLANPKKVSFFSSLPLSFLEPVFTPLRNICLAISYAFVRLFGVRVSPSNIGISEADIRTMFAISKTKGVVKKKEKDMIENILDFKELNAADIMTPRIDIGALDITKNRSELINDIRDNQFSRYPVYIHSLDNVVGVLHAKDFMLSRSEEVMELVRKPYFAPESMRIDDLLQALQKKHMHMAIVTDEYGVTSGIVTIEDILEEIVGEIRDERDFEIPNIRKEDQKTYQIDGQTHIGDVNDEIGLGIVTDEVDTIGGYITLVLGHIPQAGENIEINGHRIIVEDVSNNRVTIVTVEKL